MPRGLGEILADSGEITLPRLKRASDWQRLHGGTIDRALLATGAVSEETLLDALSRMTGLPSVSRGRLAAAPPEVFDTLPAVARRRLRAFPFDRRGDVLHVAVVDPGNPVLETGLVASTGCDVRLHVTASPILEDLLRERAPVRTAPEETSGNVPRAASPRPESPRPPPEPAAADPDPFARLARALLADVTDEGAQAVEIGPGARSAFVRTYAGGAVLTTRPLPSSVLEPLVAWLVAHSRPAGPFDEGGLVLEKAGRRTRVAVTAAASGGAWLVLTPASGPARAAGVEICLHEGAEGEVFCPACGAPV